METSQEGQGIGIRGVTPGDWRQFWWIVGIVAFGLLGVLAIARVRAEPPAGADMTLHAWFERQHNLNGGWCCDIADGHVLEDEDTRIIGGQFEVSINGAWRKIAPWMMRQSAFDDPNPTGHPIVWYMGSAIYCFAPGTMP